MGKLICSGSTLRDQLSVSVGIDLQIMSFSTRCWKLLEVDNTRDSGVLVRTCQSDIVTSGWSCLASSMVVHPSSVEVGTVDMSSRDLTKATTCKSATALELRLAVLGLSMAFNPAVSRRQCQEHVSRFDMPLSMLRARTLHMLEHHLFDMTRLSDRGVS